MGLDLSPVRKKYSSNLSRDKVVEGQVAEAGYDLV